MRLIGDAGVNVEYAYGGGPEASPTASIVVGVDDAARAAAAAGVSQRECVGLKSEVGSLHT